MRCSYCIQEAEFMCGSQRAYVCGSHFETHMKTLEKHEFEFLDISLEQSRLERLKSEISMRIKKIKETENMIAYTTKSLIKTIKMAYKEAVKSLESLSKNYFEILEQKKFCTSEIPIIEKIEMMVLEVKTVEIYQIVNQIEKVYGGELVNYIDKRGNSYTEMSLKQKIDYYHPIVLRNNWWPDLNTCQSWGKELLVSNDGKHLFFCKLH